MIGSPLFPFVLCGLAGATLAVLELFQTFDKWLGRYWTNRYVLALIVLNVVTAAAVFAFLRYALGVENSLWLALVTGLTFPAILRSRFTLYRPPGQGGNRPGRDDLALTLDAWYSNLQNRCYEEVNAQIAVRRAEVVARLRRCLTEEQLAEHLSDHVAAGLLPEARQLQQSQLAEIQSLPLAADRERRLAILALELLPDKHVRRLLEKCP
ncbi:MAG: hypothetical protein AB1791_14155 [Chloroflexota bacterium]